VTAERPATPQAAALARALEPLDLHVRVEVRDRLAVLHTAGSETDVLADGAVRGRVAAAARAHGFTHVAIAVGGG